MSKRLVLWLRCPNCNTGIEIMADDSKPFLKPFVKDATPEYSMYRHFYAMAEYAANCRTAEIGTVLLECTCCKKISPVWRYVYSNDLKILQARYELTWPSVVAPPPQQDVVPERADIPEYADDRWWRKRQMSIADWQAVIRKRGGDI